MDDHNDHESLARTLLGKLHPDIAVTEKVLRTAVDAVKEDPLGAEVLAGVTPPPADASPEWLEDLEEREDSLWYVLPWAGEGVSCGDSDV